MSILSEHAQEIATKRYFHEGEDWEEGLSQRVSYAVSQNEQNKTKWEKIFMEEISDMRFIPGGRILRNAGLVKQSLLNCACVPIKDNIESIGDAIRDSLVLWKYGAGIGINFSALREKGRALATSKGDSSGMLSFLLGIDGVAKLIETGGQRRSGALGLLDVSHPEIFDFINAKTVDGQLPYFNLSVGITEAFLRAVEDDKDWDLVFAGQTVKTVKAKELWNQILDNAIKHGCPGLINLDNMRKNNSYYFQQIEACNLCGEIPLPGYGMCVLGSLNLTKFIINKNTNWKKLETSIANAVRFLDNVIDINFFPLPETEVITKDSRRIGLGVMGLHDYLMAKGIRYGSEKSLVEIDKLFKFLRDTAYTTSIALSAEKGSFPMFDRAAYSRSSFIRKLPAHLRLEIKEYGIRNCCMISAQPTGTTSLIADVSSGIEPIFSLAYRRDDRVSTGRYYIHPRLLEFLTSGEKVQPDFLVDAHTLTPEDHLEVQSTVQRYCDNAVSKTINCPKDITKSKLSTILLEYIHDLKGVTIYVDESKEGQILNKVSEKELKEYIEKNNIITTMSEEDVKCATGACEF